MNNLIKIGMKSKIFYKIILNVIMRITKKKKLKLFPEEDMDVHNISKLLDLNNLEIVLWVNLIFTFKMLLFYHKAINKGIIRYQRTLLIGNT